jgi:polyisoprenoid-binding protein YceI
MKKISFAIIALLTVTVFTAFAVQQLWKSEKGHSEITFVINHLGISQVSGTLDDFDVTINSSKEDFSDAVVELKANAASINTRLDARDKHLKNADFFDVEKFPEITFKSTKISPNGKNKYILQGNLTIKGITKSTSLDLTYNGTVKNPMNQAPNAGFTLHGTIKRSDFSVGNKFPEPMLSDEVRITASGEFAK